MDTSHVTNIYSHLSTQSRERTFWNSLLILPSRPVQDLRTSASTSVAIIKTTATQSIKFSKPNPIRFQNPTPTHECDLLPKMQICPNAMLFVQCRCKPPAQPKMKRSSIPIDKAWILHADMRISFSTTYGRRKVSCRFVSLRLPSRLYVLFRPVMQKQTSPFAHSSLEIT